ncbi:MAG: hypothetical protein AAGC56_14970, partial [Pseudomonadota bacterium]
MSIRTIFRAFARSAAFLAAAAAPATAQEPTGEEPSGPAGPPATAQNVERTELARDAFSTGLYGAERGALPADLWAGADPALLADLLDAAPARPGSPAVGALMARSLLADGRAPQSASADAVVDLSGKKLAALARAGFVDEARTIATFSTAPKNAPAVAQALAEIDLLSNDLAGACGRGARLTAGRDGLYWLKLRVLCYAAAGEVDAADLTLGLLRERGVLSEADDAYLGSAATGVAPGPGLAPQNGLQLAALRRLGAAPSVEALAGAGGGVVRSLADDAEVDPALRLAAVREAAAMGVAEPAAVSEVFSAAADAADFDVAAEAGAAEALADAPDDPMTDVLVRRAVAGMAEPAFMRDRARLIAGALGVADDFPRFAALAALYEPEIVALDGALVAPSEAGRFALARMARGDAAAAGRWLNAMLNGQGAAALDDETALEFVELASLYRELDAPAAARLSDVAGVALTPREARTGAAGGAAVDRERLAVAARA